MEEVLEVSIEMNWSLRYQMVFSQNYLTCLMNITLENPLMYLHQLKLYCY